jgi:hypothetical protein
MYNVALPTRCATSLLKSESLIGTRKSCRTGQGIRQRRPHRRDGERNRQQSRGSENRPGKEGMRLPSEQPACPSRKTPSVARTASDRRQSERGGKVCWNAEHPDRDWPSGGTANIANQPLLPTETIPGALCARASRTLRVAKWWPVVRGSSPGAGGARAACRHADGLCGESSA